MKQKPQKPIKERRANILTQLAGEYQEVMVYGAELRRAMESFTGDVPDDSPIRYLRFTVGNAVVHYLKRAGKPQTIPELVTELQAGNCSLGVVKSPEEIVRKAVAAYVKNKRLRWMDKKETLVGLP